MHLSESTLEEIIEECEAIGCKEDLIPGELAAAMQLESGARGMLRVVRNRKILKEIVE